MWSMSDFIDDLKICRNNITVVGIRKCWSFPIDVDMSSNFVYFFNVQVRYKDGQQACPDERWNLTKY